MAETRKLDDWTPLPAERKLATEMSSGLIVKIGDGTLPPENLPETDPRVLRTSFLRALILGQISDHPPHEKGVRVQGAYLLGDGPPVAETRGLDLEGCDLSSDLCLFNCRIPDLLLLRGARLCSLFLDGSILTGGMHADGLSARRGVFLRLVETQAEVRLVGTEITGNLECDGARFLVGSRRAALLAASSSIGGSVFFRQTFTTAGVFQRQRRRLEAKGRVILRGAKIAGDVDCRGGRFTVEGGDAIGLDGAKVDGALFLLETTEIKDCLDLTAAQIGILPDDPECWPRQQGHLILNRFRFDSIVGDRAPTDATSRIRWLSLQDESRWVADFWPQPWEECARVLREMGHGMRRGRY